MAQKLFTRNFTLLILGQVSSLFGNLILRFALSMYVLETTGSATIFAGILAVAMIPSILLSPLGGILADRANRRTIMVTLDALSGLSILCAVLLLRGGSMTVIASLLVVLSVLGAFEMPTVQACVPQMQTGDNLVKGNAAVNQVAAVATLLAPILGSVLYVAFGLTPVMVTSVVCFLVTAALECRIQLDFLPQDRHGGIAAMIKSDFSVSAHFISREQPGILRLLLLIALARFFVMGTVMVGLPYLVRTVLGLNAGYYGAAESSLAVATIVGGIAAGLLTGKLKTRRLSRVLGALGAFLIPAGVVFLLPTGVLTRYAVQVVAFCGVQIAATIFSVFTLSVIQAKTPNHLIGKVMAYTATITMCVQPLGQIIYGVLFDTLRDTVALVLIPTGVVVCVLGLLATGFFGRLEQGTDCGTSAS